MSSIVVKIEFVAGAALLLAIVVLVFIAALMRFLGDPLIWSVDLAQLLFIWLCFVGAARTMRLKGHIGVDLAVRMLGYRYRLWLETAQAVIFVEIGIFGLGGVFRAVLWRFRRGRTTDQTFGTAPKQGEAFGEQ